MTKGFQRFPDFGKELKRPFPVHESCYDCAEFYDGCNAWPESKAFTCGKYNRLPDVMPGTCGQEFPETAKAIPTDVDRRCGCGEPLAKGKQCCDGCRQQNRRESKREYMRNYMQGRRAG